jgi:DNA-directed RNA polymerase sigma subunit (sigma70/sigma32)
MRTYLWPGDTGWPLPDQEDAEPYDVVDLEAELDLDALTLHVPPPHLFDGLTSTERTVLGARFGLGGQPVRSMKELHAELDLTRHELRETLASALAKLRDQLAG